VIIREVLAVKVGQANSDEGKTECPGELLELAPLRHILKLGLTVNEFFVQLEFNERPADNSLAEEHVVEVIKEVWHLFECVRSFTGRQSSRVLAAIFEVAGYDVLSDKAQHVDH